MGRRERSSLELNHHERQDEKRHERQYNGNGNSGAGTNISGDLPYKSRRERHKHRIHHDLKYANEAVQFRRSDQPQISRNNRSPSSHGASSLFVLSVLLAISSISFFILPSYMTNDQSEKQQYASPIMNWSKRKMLSAVGSDAAVPIDKTADIFLRTGKLTGTPDTSTLQQSSNHNAIMSDVKPVVARTKKVGHTHKHKRNRLLHSTKLSLAEMNGWPPITELIDGDGEIAGHEDISWILDFAIIGFPKTGTTSILRHLSNLTHLPPSESCDLVVNGTAKLVRDMYADRNKRLDFAERNGEEFVERPRGLKCPQDAESSVHNYARYFPKTKLIVGIRHPVLWFESLYNFRVTNVPWKKMLHTSKLTRGCPSGSQGVCAQRANFADFLSQLGKTSMASASELDLLSLGLNPVKTPVGKVFLYDVSQLSESDDGGVRSTQFRTDLQTFLGLTEEISPFPAVDTSGRFDFLAPIKKQTDKDKIDICSSEHDRIRDVLMEKARRSSAWIRDYFLQSSDVFVSSRAHFLELLGRWNVDLCTNRSNVNLV